MPDIERLLPYLQVTTAVAPLVVALLIRLVTGPSRLTGILLSATTTWMAINVILAPFTDLRGVANWLR